MHRMESVWGEASKAVLEESLAPHCSVVLLTDSPFLMYSLRQVTKTQPLLNIHTLVFLFPEYFVLYYISYALMWILQDFFAFFCLLFFICGVSGTCGQVGVEGATGGWQ